MEIVRRKKMCLYLKERKLNKMKKFERKKSVYNQGENVNTCSNDPDICHPYEDNINLVNVMADILLTAKDLHQCTFWHWDEVYTLALPHQPNEVQYRRYSNSSSNLIILTSEVYYADKRRAWCTADEHYETIFSKMGGNLSRNVPDCGNYINHAHDLYETAERSVANCENKREKQVHLQKLKLFQALVNCKR